MYSFKNSWGKVRVALLSAALLLTVSATQAQRHDLGMWVGTASYFGDLNTQTSLRFIDPSVGLFYRYNIDYRISLRMNVCGGQVWADDRWSPVYVERVRNLRFFSNIYEASAQIEFNFMPFSTTNAKTPFTPYLFTGFGVFHFKPKAKYNDVVYDLQSLGTEGQGFPEYPDLKRYKLTSSAILIGGGFKFRVVQNLGLQLEAGLRKTYTDYLDDVSGVYANQNILLHEGGATVAYLADPSVDITGEPIEQGKMRGDNTKSDDYLFIGVGVFYTINPYKCPFPNVH